MSQFYAPDARSAKTCRKSQLRRYTISVSGVDKSDGLVKSLHRDRSVSCGRRRRAAHPTMADHDDRRAVKQRDNPKTLVDYRGFQLRLEFRGFGRASFSWVPGHVEQQKAAPHESCQNP